MLLQELILAVLIASCPAVVPDRLPQITFVPERAWAVIRTRWRLSPSVRAITVGDFVTPGSKRVVYAGPKATVADLCHEMRHVKHGKWHR